MTQHGTPLQPWITRSTALYQRLLTLYPPAFRRAYGAQLTQTFRDTCRQAAQDHGLPGLARCWLALLGDLTSNAFAERFVEGCFMSRTMLIRLVGLLTLVSVVALIPILFSTRTSLVTAGPVFLTLPEGVHVIELHLYSLISLAANLVVDCFLLLALLSVVLLQRTWLGRISGGLALLGQIGLTLFIIWLLSWSRGPLRPLTSSDVQTIRLWGVLLPFVASLVLGLGLVVCGIVTWKASTLPGWNGLLLLLGLWVGLGTAVLWSLQWMQPRLFLEGSIFIGDTSGMSLLAVRLLFTLYALISYGLWAWLGFTLWRQKAEPQVQIQAAIV